MLLQHCVLFCSNNIVNMIFKFISFLFFTSTCASFSKRNNGLSYRPCYI